MYNTTNGEWKFTPNQYDLTFVQHGTSISQTYNGWTSFFGWASSGYSTAASEISNYSSQYGPECDISNTNHDWGQYNAISNGGNKPGMWRTLTIEEWHYVIAERPNSCNLIGPGYVNNVYGQILLPDNWVCPNDVTFNPTEYNYYSVEQWAKMENQGAVFLPAQGWRNMGVNEYGSYSSGSSPTYNSSSYHRIGDWGKYWSSSYSSASNAHCLMFYKGSNAYTSSELRQCGMAVRLVQDL